MNDALRAAREDTVREHMDTEARHDFEATLRTFQHARYRGRPYRRGL